MVTFTYYQSNQSSFKCTPDRKLRCKHEVNPEPQKIMNINTQMHFTIILLYYSCMRQRRIRNMERENYLEYAKHNYIYLITCISKHLNLLMHSLTCFVLYIFQLCTRLQNP